MLSAMASVRMMVGAMMEIGVSLIPKCPANPTAVNEENPTTMSVASVPLKLRRANIMITIRNRYISGISV